MSKSMKTDIADCHQYGVNLEARKLYLMGDVDSEMAYRALINLDLLERKAADKPITIIMNSYGGDVYQGFAIFDMIRKFPADVTIIGTGAVMSMAAMILQAAKTRVLDPYATVLLHHGSDHFEGDAQNFERWGDFAKRLRRTCNQILAARTGKSETYWNNKQKSDLILTAREALDLGLADEVLP